MHKLMALCLTLFFAACAALPYKYSGDLYPSPKPFIAEPQISRGQENTVVDGLGHYLFSLPEKLVLWNWKMGRHNISTETEERVDEYLRANDLKEVKVRLNEYDPVGEWQRLVDNQAVGPGWRYTIGTLTLLLYTLLPGRLFGGDNYNPYTNTVSIYSDLPSVALHEAGHAKDTAQRDYKGSRAALRIVPGVALVDESIATGDAVGWVKTFGTTEEKKDAYKILYPAYGTYIGGTLGELFPPAHYAALICAIPGHIVGRIKASHVEETPAVPEPKE